jgi:hypothetical protein
VSLRHAASLVENAGSCRAYVKELLRRWAAGHSNRKIARETGTDRDTAGRYIAVAEQLTLPRNRELSEVDIHEVAQRVQARPLTDPSAERKAVVEHKLHIIEWLGKKRPLRLSKIHTLLVRDHGTRCTMPVLPMRTAGGHARRHDEGSAMG